MIYKSEILTGIDANIARIQDRLNAELPWSANCDIFGRISINKKNDSNVLEWYASNGEYREIFINDQKSIIGFLVDETRAIITNKVDVSILFSIYIPLTYLDTINHDEHVIMDAQRVLRNSGLINVNEINTDFEALYKGVNIKRIQHRNLYPFVNFVITGTMRYVDKCLNYVIARNLTYSSFSAVYAVDTNYNDIITCSLTVTNNTSVAQNVTIYFRLGDYFVQITHVVPENSSYTFTYDFEDVDIYVENIVIFHDSAMVQIGSVTLVATPQFEMYFEATEQNPQFYIMLMSWIPGNYIVYDDGTSEEISVAYSTYYYKTFTPGKHLIYFSNSKEIKTFRWLTNPETFLKPQIYITNQFWKLSNLQYLYLYLYTSDLWFENITILPNELLRMKKIEVLYIRSIRNCPLKIYYPETLGNLYFSQITNPQTENNFFQKLSNVSNIQADLSNATFSITLPELLFFIKITIAVIFNYFNCPNISRDSNLGNGYVYNFRNSNLTSQACDNLIYVIRNTNNYTGPYTKSLDLSSNSRRTHASDADLAILLSRGWVVTVSEPL